MPPLDWLPWSPWAPAASSVSGSCLLELLPGDIITRIICLLLREQRGLQSLFNMLEAYPSLKLLVVVVSNHDSQPFALLKDLNIHPPRGIKHVSIEDLDSAIQRDPSLESPFCDKVKIFSFDAIDDVKRTGYWKSLISRHALFIRHIDKMSIVTIRTDLICSTTASKCITHFAEVQGALGVLPVEQKEYWKMQFAVYDANIDGPLPLRGFGWGSRSMNINLKSRSLKSYTESWMHLIGFHGLHHMDVTGPAGEFCTSLPWPRVFSLTVSATQPGSPPACTSTDYHDCHPINASISAFSDSISHLLVISNVCKGIRLGCDGIPDINIPGSTLWSQLSAMWTTAATTYTYINENFTLDNPEGQLCDKQIERGVPDSAHSQTEVHSILWTKWLIGMNYIGVSDVEIAGKRMTNVARLFWQRLSPSPLSPQIQFETAYGPRPWRDVYQVKVIEAPVLKKFALFSRVLVPIEVSFYAPKLEELLLVNIEGKNGFDWDIDDLFNNQCKLSNLRTLFLVRLASPDSAPIDLSCIKKFKSSSLDLKSLAVIGPYHIEAVLTNIYFEMLENLQLDISCIKTETLKNGKTVMRLVFHGWRLPKLATLSLTGPPPSRSHPKVLPQIVGVDAVCVIVPPRVHDIRLSTSVSNDLIINGNHCPGLEKNQRPQAVQNVWVRNLFTGSFSCQSQVVDEIKNIHFGLLNDDFRS